MREAQGLPVVRKIHADGSTNPHRLRLNDGNASVIAHHRPGVALYQV